jgi:hypothetical protein
MDPYKEKKQSKIKATDMSNTEGKIRHDRNINEIIIQFLINKLLIELQEKLLQWFGHAKRMDIIRI